MDTGHGLGPQDHFVLHHLKITPATTSLQQTLPGFIERAHPSRIMVDTCPSIYNSGVQTRNGYSAIGVNRIRAKHMTKETIATDLAKKAIIWLILNSSAIAVPFKFCLALLSLVVYHVESGSNKASI